MRHFSNGFGCRMCILSAVVASVIFGAAANAAVTVIGVQYQQDDPMPEYACIWYDKYYPVCDNLDAPLTGANIHVYLKNTGASAVAITDVTLAGYSLATSIKLNTSVHDARSIYFKWDYPPADILAAGEPVWYKGDPSTIAAGGVAQAVVRLRVIPTVPTLPVAVVTSGGTVNTSIPVDANAAQLASVGFSQDRKKVYLTWRRSGGAAPTTIKMDGNDVTASAVTVGDVNVNYAATVLSFSTALTNMSYHVYQGVYSDGKTATASVRTWVNKFIHASYNTFDVESNPNYTIADWIAEASNHGFNNCQVSVGNVVGYMFTAAGAADCVARGYGYTTGDKTKFDTRNLGPDMFFLNDEVDAEDANMERTFCGTGLKLPCGHSSMGILAARTIAFGEELRAMRPFTPTSVNMDGTHKPENYYAYGQAVDILQADPYYQRRMQDAYWRDQNVIPVYEKATYIYAVSKAVTRAAEPNPSNILLYSCSWKCMTEDNCDAQYVGQVWPFATPEAKRIEAYYALAAGVKGLGYWWFNWSGWPAHGLGDQSTQAAKNLWYEMGLYGNEIKTLAPQLVTSHPVDMTLAPGANVWAKVLASGTDTFILLAVNDNYYNDTTGCHYTNVSNATVTATLPSWMTSPGPTAFEITPGGLVDVSTQLNGSQLQLNLGTLKIAKMIVLTKSPSLRATIQQRYQEKVWPGICVMAPEYCTPQNDPPSIVQHPSSQSVVPGGSTIFTAAASGTSPLSYQWQKNQANQANGGHYSGCTTAVLTVSSVDSNDVASYRCIVTNAYGAATSNAAALTLAAPGAPTITLQPSSQSISGGGSAAFSVAATGSGTLSYQWQKNQANQANGGHYAGATTPTLTISNADSNDAANYRCVVSSTYGSATSNEATLTVSTCPPYTALQNGDFENWPTGLVAPNWTGAFDQSVANQFVRSTTAHGGSYSQAVKARDATNAWAHVYQAFDTNVGDAITIMAYAYPTAIQTGANPQVGINTSSARPSSWLYTLSTFTKNTWSTIGPLAFNATSTTTYLFLDVKRVGSVDTTTYWDDVAVYRAHVPPAPMVGTPTSTSLKVNVDPGCNSTNIDAEYAITIGGGAYTLGTHWIQANGSAGTSTAWQTDAVWANKTITGLTTDTLYTFKVKARYSGGFAQETALGAGATGTPSSECIAPAAPTGAQASPSSICNGSSSVLSATPGSGGDTVEWFADSCGTTPVEGGASPTVSPSVTTTYYARTKNSATGCTSSTCATVTVTVSMPTPADFDQDCDVDQTDFDLFVACISGPNEPPNPGCESRDFDWDGDVDQSDFGIFQRCYSGENMPGDPNCAN